MRISCPPTRNPCHFGIDFPTRDELVAHNRPVDEIKDFIGADSLGYLSLEGLFSAEEQPADYCTGCFSGIYPMELREGQTKQSLEYPHAVTV